MAHNGTGLELSGCTDLYRSSARHEQDWEDLWGLGATGGCLRRRGNYWEHLWGLGPSVGSTWRGRGGSGGGGGDLRGLREYVGPESTWVGSVGTWGKCWGHLAVGTGSLWGGGGGGGGGGVCGEWG